MSRRPRTGTVLTVFLTCAAPLAATRAADVGGCAVTVPDRVLVAEAGNYLTQVASLRPGDLLRLAPGTYAQGLTFFEHHGEPGRCIVVEGPETGPPAVFTGHGPAAWLPALEIKAGPTIFADGFESGNLLAWSASVP